MSINWANKYANIDAKTANPEREKTFEKVWSLIGEESKAGT